MRNLRPSVLLAVSLALAGCETQSAGETPSSAVAPAPYMDQSVPQVARAACLREVARVTNAAPLTITGMIYSKANSHVTIAVGPQRAPWLCLVSQNGTVESVMSQTNEGNL